MRVFESRVSIVDVALKSNAESRYGRHTLRFGSRWHAHADSFGPRTRGTLAME
jgi:hypothetical protein